MQLRKAETMQQRQQERRAAAARHSATLRPGGPRLRQGDRFCFTGGLCDYAANSDEYRGQWARLRNGMWAFTDEQGRPHEAHMPVDLQAFYGMTTAQAAAIIAAEQDGVERTDLARQFSHAPNNPQRGGTKQRTGVGRAG